MIPKLLPTPALAQEVLPSPEITVTHFTTEVPPLILASTAIDDEGSMAWVGVEYDGNRDAIATSTLLSLDGLLFDFIEEVTSTLGATTTNISTGYNAGPQTKTWAHTVSGTNRLLVLSADIWQDTGGVGTITSASGSFDVWGGSATIRTGSLG